MPKLYYLRAAIGKATLLEEHQDLLKAYWKAANQAYTQKNWKDKTGYGVFEPMEKKGSYSPPSKCKGNGISWSWTI